jgi:hypothetical protein
LDSRRPVRFLSKCSATVLSIHADHCQPLWPGSEACDAHVVMRIARAYKTPDHAGRSCNKRADDDRRPELVARRDFGACTFCTLDDSPPLPARACANIVTTRPRGFLAPGVSSREHTMRVAGCRPADHVVGTDRECGAGTSNRWSAIGLRRHRDAARCADPA